MKYLDDRTEIRVGDRVSFKGHPGIGDVMLIEEALIEVKYSGGDSRRTYYLDPKKLTLKFRRQARVSEEKNP